MISRDEAAGRRSYTPVRRFAASSSSSSGLEGGFETRTSSTGSTTPTPRKCAQTRLAMLRAKYGLRGEASHSAITRRRSSPGFRSGSSPPRNLGFTFFLVRKCCDSPAFAVEDDDFLGVVGVLAADLGEEGVEAVVVVHRPAVERMVVALGALDAHAHEHLGDVLGQLEAVELALVVVHRRDGHRAAVGGQEVDDDLVDRAVLADLVGQPVVVEQRVLVEKAARCCPG